MSLMGQGIMLIIIGMGTVFLSLIALAVLIRVLDGLASIWEGGPAPAGEPAAGVAATPVGGAGEEELLPVITAAVGAYLKAQSEQVFMVDVKRPDRSKWVMDGRVAALSRADAYAGGDRV